jgi:hypothetical protein
LLTSLWKSGKTTLLAVLLSRMKDSGELLGLPARPCRALVLSEENPALWGMRRQRLAFGEHVGLISQPFPGKPTDADWQALIAHSATILGADGGRLPDHGAGVANDRKKVGNDSVVPPPTAFKSPFRSALDL